MDLNKINDFICSLPKNVVNGQTQGNEFSIECTISGSVAIYNFEFKDFSFEVQKEGSHFLILSRYYQGITSLNKFDNGEILEDELINAIKESLKLYSIDE